MQPLRVVAPKQRSQPPMEEKKPQPSKDMHLREVQDVVRGQLCQRQHRVREAHSASRRLGVPRAALAGHQHQGA